MLLALGELASAQTKGTQQTMKALSHFLNYCATTPDASITYTSSDMILSIHSDALYLSAPEAKSLAGGFFYYTNASPNIDYAKEKLNGPVHCEATKLKHVMASATEAETGALFLNMPNLHVHYEQCCQT